MGKFVISTRKDGDFQFNLKAANGQDILSSQGYNAKASCMNGVESVKKHAPDDKNYERKEASDGRHYFNLKASNGQVIGKSQMYESQQGRDNGIESVKTNAPDALVDDQS